MSYMYYVFLTTHIYIYFTKNIDGLQHCLDWVTSREGFQVSPKGFKTVTCPQAIFDTYMMLFIDMSHTYTYMFFFFKMFSTFRCSKLETFMVYYVRSLSMLYSHSLISFFLGQVLLLLLSLMFFRLVVENLSVLLSCKLIFLSDHPLDGFHILFCFRYDFHLIYGDLYVMCYHKMI